MLIMLLVILGERLMLPLMLTITYTIDIRIIMPTHPKGQTTITLQPILPLFLKGQRLIIDQQHITKTHIGITMEEDINHTTTRRMVGCITGLMHHGIADTR
jgi:hypothetical protein